MRKKSLFAAVAALTLVSAGSADAQTFFNNRAAFQAAAGSLFTEGFESIAVSLPQSSLTFTHFVLSENDGTNAVTSTAVNSSFGLAPVTQGSVAVWYDENDDSFGTFAFTSAIGAFGVDVTADLGGTMAVFGDVTTSFALSTDTPQFFGVIWLDGFDTISFDMSGSPLVGFDYVEYGEAVANQVPEPTAFALLGLGGLGLLLRRRRRV